MSGQRIVAVGLLTQRDLDTLGRSFDRAYPIDETPCFDALLEAIDRADRDFRAHADPAGQSSGVAGMRSKPGFGARND